MIYHGSGSLRYSRHVRGGHLAGMGLMLCAALAVPVARPGPARVLEAATASVSLSGIDLSTAQGLSAARERITAAANRLCGAFEDVRKADHAQLRAECVQESVTRALAQLRAAAAASRQASHGTGQPAIP